ncbi:MAG: hypothetical protein AAFN79_21745 [Pseudomonadota bacterium]
MKITARCHPALEPLLPKPVPASPPAWLRAMPSEVAAETLGGADIRTLKHCPPLIDALSLGVLIPLATDLEIAGGEIAWDWDPPIIEDAPISRAPVGVHAPEQAAHAPFAQEGLIVKFMNFWTLETEPGWSLLFTHPLNRPDLPFETLSGVVDADAFQDGYVHFPALWRDPLFEGAIAKGTPIAQAIPIRRAEAELAVKKMTAEDVAASAAVQEALEAERGVYRKRFRR